MPLLHRDGRRFTYAQHSNGVRLKLVAGSLPARVLEFYADNPKCELTYADACVIFDCKMSALSMALTKLTEAGYLETPRVIRVYNPKKGKP
jgi:hypothetical protein